VPLLAFSDSGVVVHLALLTDDPFNLVFRLTLFNPVLRSRWLRYICCRPTPRWVHGTHLCSGSVPLRVPHRSFILRSGFCVAATFRKRRRRGCHVYCSVLAGGGWWLHSRFCCTPYLHSHIPIFFFFFCCSDSTLPTSTLPTFALLFLLLLVFIVL